MELSVTRPITYDKISTPFTDCAKMGATLSQLHIRELCQLMKLRMVPLGFYLRPCSRHCVDWQGTHKFVVVISLLQLKNPDYATPFKQHHLQTTTNCYA